MLTNWWKSSSGPLSSLGAWVQVNRTKSSGLKKRWIVQFGFQVKEVWFKKKKWNKNWTYTPQKIVRKQQNRQQLQVATKKIPVYLKKKIEENNGESGWKGSLEKGEWREGGRQLNFLYRSSPSQIFQNSTGQYHYQLNWTSKFTFLGARN